MEKKIKITQVRSTIKRIENQKRVIRALGFSKVGQTKIHVDTPSIRGMVAKVKHLVTIEEMNGE